MSPVSHRIGRKTSLLSAPGIRRATVTELLEVAADAKLSDQAANSARLIVRTTAGQHELAVHDANGLDLDDLLPTRRPPSYHGMRNYIGQVPVPSRREPRSVWFESLNELAHIRNLLMETPVAALATQPVLVIWPLPSGGHRYHYPDLLAVRADGRSVACDVTSRERTNNPRLLAQLALMSATAAAAGWEFEVLTQLPAQRIRNQAHLWAYRQADAHRRSEWLESVERGNWPMQFEAAASLMGGGPIGIGAVQHLIATARLFIDFDEVIRPDTLVHRQPLTGGLRPWLMRI